LCPATRVSDFLEEMALKKLVMDKRKAKVKVAAQSQEVLIGQLHGLNLQKQGFANANSA